MEMLGCWLTRSVIKNASNENKARIEESLDALSSSLSNQEYGETHGADVVFADELEITINAIKLKNGIQVTSVVDKPGQWQIRRESLIISGLPHSIAHRLGEDETLLDKIGGRLFENVTADPESRKIDGDITSIMLKLKDGIRPYETIRDIHKEKE